MWRTPLWLLAQVADAHVCPGADRRYLRAVVGQPGPMAPRIFDVDLGCGRTLLIQFLWNRPKSRSGFQRVPWERRLSALWTGGVCQLRPSCSVPLATTHVWAQTLNIDAHARCTFRRSHLAQSERLIVPEKRRPPHLLHPAYHRRWQRLRL